MIGIGLGATLSSAWIIAWAMPPFNFSHSEGPSKLAQWIDPTPPDWPEHPSMITYQSSRPSVDNPTQTRQSSRLRVRQGMYSGVFYIGTSLSFADDQPQYVIDQYRVGWPLNSMQYRGPDDSRPSPSNSLVRLYTNGIPVFAFEPLGLQANRALPLKPLWRAFGVNTVVFAAFAEFVWQLWKLPLRIRLRNRKRKGLCLACGYAVEDLERCPECGSDHAACSPG